MSEWTMKRFWTKAAAKAEGEAWTITLDGRGVRTPSKALLTVPTQALADAIAAEWDAQDKEIDPNSMPLTRLANSAQDKVAVQHGAVADMLADYGGSDLLCYRAQMPEALIARQAQAWDPLLDWARETHGIALEVQAGLMPKLQSDQSLLKMSELTHALPAPILTGFHEFVTLSGSWVIAYATLTGCKSPEALWDIALLDEIWQEEQWGVDEEAQEARQVKKEAFLTADRFVRLCES